MSAAADDRPPLVLIAPSYGNPATRQRFADTLAEPVNFLDGELTAALSDADAQELLSWHPGGTARVWGALPSHNGIIDRLRPGDLVVFTGQNRVQAIGALACKLRNQELADLLWPPNVGVPGWVNVYTVVNFRRLAGPSYTELRTWVGSSERDVFQSARVLTLEKSAAVLNGLAHLGAFDGALDAADELGPSGHPGPATELTLDGFEGHLHTAVEMVAQGRRDHDAKWYLLGILLLKYASDTFEAERDRTLPEPFPREGSPDPSWRSLADQPGPHSNTLQVPPEARWSYLMAHASDGVGHHLNQALWALEAANPAVLGGVLGHVDFTREVGGERLSDQTLRNLLFHFAQLRLASTNAPPGMLGHGFNYVVARFPEFSSKKSGDVYAPADVARLMVGLLDPTAETTIYDPCSGVGGMLIRAAEHVSARGRGLAPAAVAGQEISGSTWALAKLNLLMHHVDNIGLARGDTLTEPMHVRAGVLERFDRVISNPPFGTRVALGQPAHPERLRWGLRSGRAQSAELLFVQHAVSVLKEEGRAAVVLPRGVLFRGGIEQTVRAALLDDDVIEAVIGLPQNLFYSTGIATCVLVLRPPGAKPPPRTGKILFVDLSAEKSGRHRRLVPDQVEELLEAYRTFEDVPGFARVVGLAEVQDIDHDLTVERYLREESWDEADAIAPDDWETHLRNLVHERRYDEASTMLGERVGPEAVAQGDWDPERVAQLKMEFAFLHFPDDDRQVVDTVWGPIARANRFASSPPRLPQADDAPSSLEEAGEEHGSDSADTTATGRTPQQSGAVLEQATVDLFSRLFHIDADNSELLVTRLRNQRAGTQYGHDIVLDCSVKGSPTVRCHLECKNLRRPIAPGDIADKLIQEKYYRGGARVDHWILISPHVGPTNELRQLLDAWEETQEYPFSVQVWSPEEGIEGLFALAPEVYQAVYDRQPSEQALMMAESAVANLQKNLAPRLPIDRVWHTYLSDPHQLCFVTEDFRHFDELYGNQVQLRVTDEKGALLKGTLLDETLAWITEGSTGPMLLLADFGEGKSFFTYSLARRLCEQYRWSPRTGVFPLRIPLKEFVQAGSGRALLQRRLEELGATLDQWRELARRGRTVVILDGFDEMTADLSPAAITENLRSIDSCLTELTGSKVLVTSRRRTLSGRDWDRMLDKLRQPTVREIASGSRDQRVRYLERFAADDRSAQILDNLRNLYDPIGLAAKPLFLQMIKDTLAELPDGDFSELILYTTFVENSLRRKIELLEDDNLSNTSSQLIENLATILEDIAIELQRSNRSFVCLRDYVENAPGGIAAMLWRMSDDAAVPVSHTDRVEDDATARIGVRSLLKAVPSEALDRWPVDFFHRSMREYFFARALVRQLRTDPHRAREILNSTPLAPEITHFVTELLREQDDSVPLSHLESFARSATLALPDTYLGGNSITLLYAARGELPNCDWSGLRLDHAQLAGADLANARFVGTSLRNANLDNADLTGVDFTNADLEGIRLEETAQVKALTAWDDERIVAAYEDGSLREWWPRAGGSYESRVIAQTEHPVERLYRTPRGRLAAIGPGVFVLYEVQNQSLVVTSRFETKPRFRLTLPGERSSLFLQETNGGRTRVLWLENATASIRDQWNAEGAVTCSAQLDGQAYAVALDDQVRVTLLDEQDNRNVLTLKIGHASCLDLGLSRDGDVLLALGQHNGQVRVERLTGTDRSAPGNGLWEIPLHAGTVATMAFGSRGQLITGGADRSVCIVPNALAGPEPSGQAEQQLHLTLRCAGVKVDGVRTDREQQRLRQHASAARALR